MPDLSIVLPTCNRAALLDRAITSIAGTTRCNYELIVVDGASTDYTREVLERHQQLLGARLKIIGEEKREGFVKAANKGFAVATGRNMMWLNDDARPLEGALDLAVRQIDEEQGNVALVALFHRWNAVRNVAYETWQNGQVYRLCHIRGTLYANFGLGRRATFEKLGWFDERFFLNGADPDLSLKAWHAGMMVVPAHFSIIDHDEHQDQRRAADTTVADLDNQKLFDKWDLPAKNPYCNDFDPLQPCTLRGLLSHPARQAA